MQFFLIKNGYTRLDNLFSIKVALIWALSNGETHRQEFINFNNPQDDNSYIDQLTKLKKLYNEGVITDKEFIRQKNKLLK